MRFKTIVSKPLNGADRIRSASASPLSPIKARIKARRMAGEITPQDNLVSLLEAVGRLSLTHCIKNYLERLGTPPGRLDDDLIKWHFEELGNRASEIDQKPEDELISELLSKE